MNSILFSQLNTSQVLNSDLSIGSAQNDKGIVGIIQRIFDITFEWYARRPNKIKPVPIWLLKLYNDFSRWKEAQSTKQDQGKSFISELIESLFQGMIENLGEANAKKIVGKLEEEAK